MMGDGTVGTWIPILMMMIMMMISISTLSEYPWENRGTFFVIDCRGLCGAREGAQDRKKR